MTTIPPSLDTDRFTSADETDPLAADLRELTADRGPETRLWEKVLDERTAKSPLTARSIFARIDRPLPRSVMAVAAFIVLAALVTAAVMPSLQSVRSGNRMEAMSAAVMPPMYPERKWVEYGTPSASFSDSKADLAVGSEAFKKVVTDIAERPDLSVPATTSIPSDAKLVQRSVIRKASIELISDDVRAAAAKAQLALRADLGEYIEGSSITGEGKEAHAQITLRVAVSRMDGCLNDLRQLAKVKSESASGDDVTEQVVDLDARLRNERRVEQEVLSLLDSRKDAPLKDVLDLRDKLAGLRQNIEQLQARKDNLARQVALATVLLIIRPVDAPPESQLAPIGAYFSTQFGSAWRSGSRNLADALAWLTRTLIGGLPLWVLLSVIVLLIRRAMRRAAMNAPEKSWARPVSAQ